MRNGCHHHIVTDTETGQWSVIKEAVVQLSTNRPITSHNVHRWKCNKRRKETAAVVGLFVALETLIGFAVWLTAARSTRHFQHSIETVDFDASLKFFDVYLLT